MPTALGTFRMRSYRYASHNLTLEPIAMIYGDLSALQQEEDGELLLRVHDQCLTSEVFGSLRCDCKDQLSAALQGIVQAVDSGRYKAGALLYLQQEGRGIGLSNKIAAYALQDAGADTVEANRLLGLPDELRDYRAVPAVLRDLGLGAARVALLTNNPFKLDQLARLGVNVSQRLPITVSANEHSLRYLTSKRDRMAHLLPADLRPQPQPQAPSVSNQSPAAAADSASLLPLPLPEHFFPDPSCLRGLSPHYALGRESVLKAIQAVAEGRLVVVVDDADRENEGDLICAAAVAGDKNENIGFMVRHTSGRATHPNPRHVCIHWLTISTPAGVLCASIDDATLTSLELPPMVPPAASQDPKGTAYSISVDYVHPLINPGSTGISAADRALTFRQLAKHYIHSQQGEEASSSSSSKQHFQRPGHVFPLRYKAGGVLARRGHTEASYDLSLLAGFTSAPGGVLAEVVHDDGSMMRADALREFSAQHGLVMTSVQDLVAYRLELLAEDDRYREVVREVFLRHHQQ